MNIPDGIYHVTARGLERRQIVRDRVDRKKWTERLGQVAKRRDWRVYAWALMDNHYHLFLRVPHADLSQGMHDFNAGYASVFNRRHGRCGPLFQGRFKSILVEKEYHYWELSRYVHLNPVRAGLVTAPETYPWSSCPLYFRSSMAPTWLAWEEILRAHGDDIQVAQRSYLRFLKEGISRDYPSPLDAATASTLLGSPVYLKRMKTQLQDQLPKREVPAARQLRVSLSADDVIQVVCNHFNVRKAYLVRKGIRGTRVRAIAIYLCRNMTGCSMIEIGRYFGGVNGQAVSNAVTKICQERNRDGLLDQQLCAVEKILTLKCRMKT